MAAGTKTILIAGGIGFENCGDDAILLAMTRELRSLLGEVELVALSNNPDRTAATCQIRAIHRQDIAKILEIAAASDLLLIGGGGLFYDYFGVRPETILTPEHGEIAYFVGIAIVATVLNKPLMMYAVGVGPLESEESKDFTRLAFSQANRITVRDSESKSLLESLGISGEQVRVTADPAFGLPSAPIRAGLIPEISGSTGQPIIGVGLRNWNLGVNADKWERVVAEALDKFIDQHNGSVWFVPFQHSREILADDTAVATRVQSQMRHQAKTTIIDSRIEPAAKAGVLANCDLVLGMRLHSIIFGIAGRKPVVGLVYDPKVLNMLKRVGMQKYGVDLRQVTVEQLVERLTNAYVKQSGIKLELDKQVEGLSNLARENARLAVELLTSEVRRPAFTEQTLSLIASLGSSASSRPANLRRAIAEFRNQLQPQDGIGFPAGLPPIVPVSTSAPIQAYRALPEARAGRKPSVAYLAWQVLDWQTLKPTFGGGERYCLTLGRLLQKLGFDVTIYQGAQRAFEREYEGFKVIGIPAGAHTSEFQHGISNTFHDLTRDYDHILYGCPELASGRMRQDALLICHGIWFDHDNYPPPTAYRTAEWYAELHQVFSNPRKIISVDTNSINVIRSLWPTLALNMTYIPNWVDTKIFHGRSQSRAQPVTILFPRRSQINRGTRLLSAILERIPHRCQILWVGVADDHAVVETAARQDGRLEVLTAAFDEMPPYYQRADICVIPSIACEGTSLACLEGLASGCAVVATNVGGLPDLIQSNINGLLVDPDPEAIAAAINYLIEQPQERLRLQQTGSSSARYFDRDVWDSRWRSVLEEAGWLQPNPSAQKDLALKGDQQNLRVAIITRNAVHGGVESMIAAHQKLFQAEVVVAGQRSSPETCPFTYHYIDESRGAEAESELSRWLAQFDLIVYHWIPAWALRAVQAAAKPSVEVVHSIPTAEGDKGVPSLVVTHSEFIADFLRHEHQIDPIVIPNAVDIERFPAARAGSYVGAVTTYEEVKGLDVFLKAWRKIEARFPEQRARFYGAGSQLPFYNQQLRELGLERVEFLGPVTQPERYWPEFRLCIMPSRSEGMPFAMLEALASNIPILCSDLPGFVEFNRLAQERGYPPPLTLFRSEDADDLSLKMSEFLERPLPTPQSRDYIGKYYSIDAHRKAYDNLFKLALEVFQDRGLSLQPAQQRLLREMRHQNLKNTQILLAQNADIQAREVEAAELRAQLHHTTQSLSRLQAQLYQTQIVADVASQEVNSLHRAKFYRATRFYWHWRDKAKRSVSRAWFRILAWLPGRVRARLLTGLAPAYDNELQAILARHRSAPGIILFLPTLKWNVTLFQRPHQLARAFARQGYLVFFCESIQHQPVVGFTEQASNLYVASVPLQIFAEIGRLITFVLPYNREFLSQLKQPFVVYEIIDHLEAFDFDQRFLQEGHTALLKEADLVVVTADNLLAEVRAARPDAILVPNGVDLAHFSRARQSVGDDSPADIQSIVETGRPVIGYYGALARWFDYELIHIAANRRPEWEFLLIGPDHDGTLPASGLAALPNVHWLGPRPYHDLPNYLRHFDIATIPFLVNDVTNATSPIKLFEYLAAQKPVVTTDMLECRKYPGVLIARDAEHFVTQIEAALGLVKDANYRLGLSQIAAENTWEGRARQVISALPAPGKS